MNVRFRSQTNDDVDFLRELYVSTRWEELAPIIDWTEAQKHAFLESQFAAQWRHYQSAYHDAEFQIVLLHDHEAGRFYLHRGESDWRVVDISLLPEHRNQGVGTAILSSLIQQADAAGIKVSIHVETFNRARRLYQRLGFCIVSQNGPYDLMERPHASAAPTP